MRRIPRDQARKYALDWRDDPLLKVQIGETFAPFDGGVKDEKVWRRGASDMKAGGTAILHAVKALAAHDVQLEADLLLSFVNGEESGRADIGIFIFLDRGVIRQISVLWRNPPIWNIFTIRQRAKMHLFWSRKRGFRRPRNQ